MLYCSVTLLFSLLVLDERTRTAATLVSTKSQGVNPKEDGLVALIVDQLVGRDHEDSRETDDGSLQSPSLPVSPQCWRSAIGLVRIAQQQQDSLFQLHQADSAAALCASLPEAHQKRLALEIANCHMQDFGKQLYQNSIIEEICTSPTEVSADTVQLCLQQLTEAGEHAYTHYITYVQILCTRRTQELFLLHQEQVKNSIASSYAAVSEQSIKNMETINRLSQRHAEQMELLNEIPTMVKDKITGEMKEHLKETLPGILGEHIKERMDDVLKSQSKEQASFFTRMMDQLQQRDFEIKDRYDEFATYQSSMMLQQAREMERQRKALEDHRMKMQTLSHTVSETTLHMKPLVGLQSLLQVASEGYTWITFLLHFLVTFNIVWLVSRPERCNPFRTYLYSLVVGEALIELALTCALRSGWLSEGEQTLCITELRRWALVIQCASYVIGFVATFFPAKPVVTASEVAMSRLDVERLLNDRMQERVNETRLVTPSSIDYTGRANSTPWATDPTMMPQETRMMMKHWEETREPPTPRHAAMSYPAPVERIPLYQHRTELADPRTASEAVRCRALQHRSFQRRPATHRYDHDQNALYPCDDPPSYMGPHSQGPLPNNKPQREQRNVESAHFSVQNDTISPQLQNGILSPTCDSSCHPPMREAACLVSRLIAERDEFGDSSASAVTLLSSEIGNCGEATNVMNVESVIMNEAAIRSTGTWEGSKLNKRSAESSPHDEPAPKRA